MVFSEFTHTAMTVYFYRALSQIDGIDVKEIFSLCVRQYGRERGFRMAQRALSQHQPLTQGSYNYFGEWVNSPKMKQIGFQSHTEACADQTLRIYTCPWFDQFQRMDALDCGKIYCSILDAAISSGFNPELGYVAEQTLHTNSYCVHRLEHGNINEVSLKGKYQEGLRDFTYHTAHVYWSFLHTLKPIIPSDMEQVIQSVQNAFQQDYGKEMLKVVLQYETVDFLSSDFNPSLLK